MPKPRVIAPTDFSESSRVGLRAAREHAEQTGRPVHVVYVWDRSTLELHDPLLRSVEAENATLVQSVEQSFSERLAEIRAELFDGVDDVSTEILNDRSPARAVAELAGADDVIVVATHGRTGMRRFLIGSVAEKIVRLSRCPVLVVPMPREA